MQFNTEQFISDLRKLASKSELESVKRFFRYEGIETQFIGIKMSEIFKLAKQYQQMSIEEVEKLLESVYYEARMGAVSIMDFKARDKKINQETKKSLYDLYLRKHTYINNWDLVDRSAPYVVGGYLFNQSRKPLYKLAKSKNVWERRTAIVSTYYFIRQNDLDDTFKIAEILINDPHDLIQKALGSWIREAGKKDARKLKDFLDQHAAHMPRTALRYAIEKLSKEQQTHYLDLQKNNSKT